MTPDPDAPRPEEPEGRLRPTSPAVVAGWGVAGLVGGWSLHRGAVALGRTAPIVTWGQALVLVLVAAILAYAAWSTYRLQARGRRLAAHQMVNRLVLARACALAGALVAGGYAGYAISWLGDPAQLAGQRIVRSAIAAVAGIATVTASLLLERACRTGADDPAP